MGIIHDQDMVRTRPDGYISVRCPCCGSWRLEHREVMKRHIGRLLRSDEYVHHKDGNRSNNSIDNLEIVSREEHARRHGQGRVFTNERKANISKALTGKVMTDEVKMKISRANKGRVQTPEEKEKQIIAQTGKQRKPMSEDWKRKISEANKGKKLSADHKAKLLRAITGRKKSAEEIAKISRANKGRVFSEEVRMKMSEAHAGKKRGPMSDESKRKKSIAMRRYWDIVKEAKDK